MPSPPPRPPRPPSPTRRRRFVRRLLRWYRTAGRRLPWRRTRDPYRILVSEVMLQQTQVDRVVPKYREFLRRYPSLEALARAHVAEVREVWYPLGYNARPVRLWQIARTVLAEHGGRLPAERARLLRLPGIGPYTAGALLSFAFGRRAALLDTNVRRVLQRVFFGRPVSDRALWALAERLLPRRAYDYNQALMDFGALICTARRPRCDRCPLTDLCRTYPRLGSEARARAGRAPAGEGVAARVRVDGADVRTDPAGLAGDAGARADAGEAAPRPRRRIQGGEPR